jgi:SAM-dependent methyltransferase
MSIDDVAARGFGSASDAYERGRPSYPDDAVQLLAAELGLTSSATVVDLAAGTGKLTRLLVPISAWVVAVEPVASMRAVLAELVPQATVVAAAAEALAFAGGSVDAVVVAQAFHWFRVDEALAEVARVLRPGGGMALLWNERDESVPWGAELSSLVRWDQRPVPPYEGIDWRAAVAATGDFSPMERARFAIEQQLDADILVDRVLSTSYVAAWPAPQQDRLAEGVRRLVAGFPERFVLPYRTTVYWCRRR